MKKPPAKSKRILPFTWIRRKAPILSKRSIEDYDTLKQGLRAFVKRFGYQRVLRAFISIAGDESIRALEIRDKAGHLYSEAFTLLDHAEKTISTIVRLEAELAELKGERR